MLPGFIPRNRPIWRGWPADRAFAFLVGGMAVAVCVVYYDVYVLGHLGDSAAVRRVYPFSEPAAGFLTGMFDAAVIMLASTIVFVILLTVVRGLGLRESNLRGWTASIAAGVVTAVGDRALNGPFQDWPASYLQFTLLFRGNLNVVLGPWGTLHPLDRLWAFGFPALCALLLLRRSRLDAEPSDTAHEYGGY